MSLRRVTIAMHIAYAVVVMVIAASIALSSSANVSSYDASVAGLTLPSAIGFAAHALLIVVGLLIWALSGARAHLFVVDVAFVVVSGVFGGGALVIISVNPAGSVGLLILGYVLSLVCGGLVAAAPRGAKFAPTPSRDVQQR